MLASVDGNGDGIMGISMANNSVFPGFNANVNANLTPTPDPVPIPCLGVVVRLGPAGLGWRRAPEDEDGLSFHLAHRT